MESPRHSPPPSAAAPRPKGILKNASESANAVPQLKDVQPSGQVSQQVDEHGNRLAWDESNLTLHEIERETQAARMKIDEPKTPFVRSASLGPMDLDGSFDLDSQGGPSYFPSGSGSSSTGGGDVASSEAAASSSSPSLTGARRSSAAEQLAANTMANAGRRPSNAGSAASSSGPTPAVGLDSADMASSTNSSTKRTDSRSPSFTLPNSRRSSAAGDRSRDGVREEMRTRDDAMEGMQQDEEAFAEDDEPLDPEAKAKQAEFARKRNAHYGNEAEAMKVAAALAAQNDDEDEDEDGEEFDGPPAIPPLPNGQASQRS